MSDADGTPPSRRLVRPQPSRNFATTSSAVYGPDTILIEALHQSQRPRSDLTRRR